MRIVTNVYRAAPVGGLEMNVFQTARALADRGHDVHLLHVEGGELLDGYRSFCARVARVRGFEFGWPLSRKQWLLDAARLVPAVATTALHRPDVVYANRIFAMSWALATARLTGAPVVSHLHGFSPIGRERAGRFADRVSRFLVVSRYCADLWLEEGMPEEKVAVLHNGIDPLAYRRGDGDDLLRARKELGLPEHVRVALYFGRIDPEKGIEVLLDAWRRLGLGPDEARLVLVGSPMVHPDPDAYLRGLRALAGPGDGVEFLPARGDVVTPLHAADVVVVPSIWDEPFGRVVVEALSTGRPAVASRTGGIPEILTGPFDRFLFEPGDADALADLLGRTLDWRDREPELADACAARVRDGLTLADMVDGVESAVLSAR